jgi:gluconolactonase
MKKIILTWLAINIFWMAQCGNQVKLVAEHAELVLVSDQFGFTEGPASDTSGNVYFTDIPNNSLYKLDLEKGTELVHPDMPGCNGLAFDNNEKLIVCGHNLGRDLYEFNLETKESKVLTEQYEGQKYNSPNDLWIDKKNGVYFTDPRYGNRDNLEMGTEQVYYLSPDRKKTTRVTHDLVKPNGILGTDKGKKLLIADPGASIVFLYKVKRDGTLKKKKVFLENEKVDGMAIDELGNIYITTDDVKVYNKKGFLVEVINTPEPPTNVCFGGKDFKTLVITARKHVYTLKMNVEGSRY